MDTKIFAKRTALSTVVLCLVSLVACDTQIGFVYEIVRHGARAPTTTEANSHRFNVPHSMLT